MKVKDVIKISAMLLANEQVVNYLNVIEEGATDTTSVEQSVLADVDLFTRLTNLVISELAGSYIMMKKSQIVRAKSGKVYYKDLDEKALQIISVTDIVGNKLTFKNNFEYAEIPTEKAIITYAYMPANYDIFSDIGYSQKEVQPNLLATGLCAEYCVVKGRFDEAIMWHKRYVDAITERCLPKNKNVKERSWF